MFTLTTQKPKKVTDTYFPIATETKQAKDFVIYIKYDESIDYYGTIEECIKKFVPDEAKLDGIMEQIEEHNFLNLTAEMRECINVIDLEYKTQISNSEFKLFKVPNVTTRDAICIYGRAGSGKSYWTANYIKIVRSYQPKKKIYLITTNVAEDPLYQGLSIERLFVDDAVVEDLEFDETSFENGLVIFDDIETHKKSVDKWINALRDLLLLKSRKHNVDVINIVHQGLGYRKTTVSNIECNGMVIFPRHDWQTSKKILDQYGGFLTESQMRFIHKLRHTSRWVYLHKNYPKYIIWESGAKLME